MVKVAIQGVKACFHDVAARKYFASQGVPEIQPVECSTFGRLGIALKTGEADFAVMAIENTIAGSILPNYSLLETHGFKILGEVYLRIEMCLLALPSQELKDIRFVQSHPMAILQCQEFLSTLPEAKAVEASDTAESAKEIQAKQLPAYAAIASKLAGATYGLNVLKENIETDRSNFTRFLILSRAVDAVVLEGANKASLRFEAEHTPGSLANILSTLSANEVNMTKIQSIPILGKPYQYGFHVDIEWNDSAKYERALEQMKTQTLNLIHFGEYCSGEKPS
jgi:prephenate dehydratase